MSKQAAVRHLQALEKNLFKKFNIKNSRLELSLLSDKEMEAVRHELVKRPDFKGPEARKIREEEYVSVLAFPEEKNFPHPEDKRKKLGEIYINYEFAKGDREALSRLFIHGLLHLLGYEHHGKNDRMEMEKLEKELYLEAVS